MHIEVPSGCALSIEESQIRGNGARADCACGEWSWVYSDTMSTDAEKLATAGWYKHLQRVNRERAEAGGGHDQGVDLGAGTDADPGDATGTIRLGD